MNLKHDGFISLGGMKWHYFNEIKILEITMDFCGM